MKKAKARTKSGNSVSNRSSIARPPNGCLRAIRDRVDRLLYNCFVLASPASCELGLPNRGKLKVRRMHEGAQTTLNLQQYECRKCGRLFYINKMDKSSLDLDFGCPYGCDDNGKYVKDIKTDIREVQEVPQKEENSGDKNEPD